MDLLYNALDVACLSSCFGEGFSNVIGEAMACGVSCVVTDVGDSAQIVGDLGKVVPPRSPDAMATALAATIQEARLRNECEVRKRRESIASRFGVSELVDRTESLLQGLI